MIEERVYTVCTRINYKHVPLNNLTNNDTMVQVELRNMYINIDATNSSEKLWGGRPLQLPLSKLQQYMLRTFVFIFFVHVNQVG